MNENIVCSLHQKKRKHCIKMREYQFFSQLSASATKSLFYLKNSSATCETKTVRTSNALGLSRGRQMPGPVTRV